MRLFIVFCLVLFMPVVAYATDVVAVDDSGLIAMIVGALPAFVDIMPAWVGVLIGVLYTVSHLVATLPAKVTCSWPSWLKLLINLLAANYGKAKNKDD